VALPKIERLSGPINGANLIFETSAEYVPGSVRVFINGLLGLQPLVDGWTELGGKRIRLNEAPANSPGDPDVIQAYYLPL
jgi:hypothetical protein